MRNRTFELDADSVFVIGQKGILKNLRCFVVPTGASSFVLTLGLDTLTVQLPISQVISGGQPYVNPLAKGYLDNIAGTETLIVDFPLNEPLLETTTLKWTQGAAMISQITVEIPK